MIVGWLGFGLFPYLINYTHSDAMREQANPARGEPETFAAGSPSFPMPIGSVSCRVGASVTGVASVWGAK